MVTQRDSFGSTKALVPESGVTLAAQTRLGMRRTQALNFIPVVLASTTMGWLLRQHVKHHDIQALSGRNVTEIEQRTHILG